MRLLDLFCGAGGSAVGYYRAGFTDITGVDNRPMPRYPFHFIQGDALEYLVEHGSEYDVIHASPPCQGYSRMRHLPWLKDRVYPMLIDPVRDLLIKTGKTYVIENVEDAPLLNGVTLCGLMFGMNLYRHRKFESNILLWGKPHIRHEVPIFQSRFINKRYSAAAGVMGVFGHTTGTTLETSKTALGIDWMNRDEITQAIPPAYTEYIGKQLMAVLR